MSQPSSSHATSSFHRRQQDQQRNFLINGRRRAPQHVNGDLHWWLRTRLFQATAWVVITALLTLDVPWHLLQQHVGEALAQSTVVFGPENFVRATGAPQTVTRTFTVTNPSGAATLCVANGGATNQFSRVSSATGTLNNSSILQPNDFNQQVATVTRAVTLLSANTLRVEVRSAPGSGFTLSIVRGTSANCPGAVTNRPPVANAGLTQTKPVTSLVTLDGSGSSDPDSNALTYLWSFVSKPATSLAALSSPTAIRPTFTIDKAGSYVLQLLVNDGQVNSAPAQVVISTSNTPPVANAGPDQSRPVGTLVTLNGAGSTDVDGNTLTYQWAFVSKPASSAAVLNNAASITPSFTIDVFGDYVVQLIVNDGMVNSVADTITISTLNSPPVANAGPDQSATVTTLITLDGRGSTDVDGNTLSYSWSLTSKPPGSTASLTNPISPTPNLRIDRAGNYVVQLVVNDGSVNSQPDTVTISTLNSKPVANAGADQSGTVGTDIHLDGSNSSDVDGNLLTYQWSLASKPAASTATLQNPTAVTPQFTLDKFGTYVVQLIVHDGTVESDPVTVTISTLNSKPTANAGVDQSKPVGATITLTGSASSDVDGDPLTYLWSLTSKPAGSTATLSDPSAVQPTFVIDTPGNYTAQLIVHDGTVTSDPATVTISTVNSKPIANPGPDQHGVVGATITLNGSSSSDVDGNSLTYQWSLTSKPATSTATLQNPANVTTSFILDKAGTYIVQLIANDGTVDSDPVTMTVTTLNSKPVASAGADQEVVIGQTVQLDGSGSQDVDNTPLSYFWSLSAVPEGSTATLANDSLVTPTFVPDLPGLYILQLIVNDGQLDSEPDTVMITVSPESSSNQPPVADVGFDQTAQVGQAVFLDGSNSSDPDGDSLIYQWVLTTIPSGSSAALTDANTATPTFVADVAGVYVVRLTVRDGRGGSATANISVTVTLGNRPPDVSVAASATSGTVPLNVTFTATASDPDQDPLTYTWDFGDGMVTNGTAIQVHTYTVARRYTATVTVSDGQALSSAQTNVLVTPASDPRTRVTGRTVDQAGNPLAGAQVKCLSESAISGLDGAFVVTGVPTIQGDIHCSALFVTTAVVTLRGVSARIPPVPAGTTVVGDIIIAREAEAIRYPGLLFPTDAFPNAMVTADFNQDGYLDVVVVRRPSSLYDTTNEISIFLGKPGQLFHPARRITSGNGAVEITSGDLNHDGKLDLITVGSTVGSTANGPFSTFVITVQLGNGDGTFQASRHFTTHNVGPLTVADLNGDGKLDVLAGSTDNYGPQNPPSILFGNGDGTLQEPQFLFPFPATGGHAFSLTDLNNDHSPDILVAGWGPPNGVSVQLNNGNGTFQAPRVFPVQDLPRALALADVNGDGHLDLATANEDNATVSVLLGNGDSTFQAERRFSVGLPNLFSLAIGDVNRDGILDLVVGSEGQFFVIGQRGNEEGNSLPVI